MSRDYSTDPRICTSCGQDLTPNYMEGSWEHFAGGCQFSGLSTYPVSVPPYNTARINFAGPFKSEALKGEKERG